MAVSETKEGDTRSHRHAKESAKYSPHHQTLLMWSHARLSHVALPVHGRHNKSIFSRIHRAEEGVQTLSLSWPQLIMVGKWSLLFLCVLMHSSPPTESHSTVDTNSMDAPFRLCMPFVPLPFSNLTGRNTVHASFQILTLYAYLFETWKSTYSF